MSEFIEHLHEVFEQFGAINSRRMFGGYGVYHDGLMFGLVADNVLYLKTDSESVRHFDARGLTPFEYSSKGKTATMSYYTAPEEIYEDPEEARVWAQRAYAAALRARKPKNRRSGTAKKRGAGKTAPSKKRVQ